MPRTGRAVVPKYPHHIVQRGHNRQAVFISHDDYLYYLDTLAEFKSEFSVKVYAFCLMTNHVHLLLSPSMHDGIAKLMKRLAGKQTRYRNKLEGRSGTIWESRYKSSIVDQNSYLLACKRYIELNPVRAGMVAGAKDYPWSSYHHHVDPNAFSWLDPSPGLTESGVGNALSYDAFLAAGLSESELSLIRGAVSRSQLTGGEKFVDEVEYVTGLRIEHRHPGRPSRDEK